jgi:hypothetical protein
MRRKWQYLKIAQGERLSYATPDNRFEGSYCNTVSSIASEAHQGRDRHAAPAKTRIKVLSPRFAVRAHES